MVQMENALLAFAGFMWGMPLVILLVGGGLFFLVHSRLLPYRHFGHAIGILRGKYDNPRDAGDIPHYQALSTALSGTLGLGNVAGVAVAITRDLLDVDDRCRRCGNEVLYLHARRDVSRP